MDVFKKEAAKELRDLKPPPQERAKAYGTLSAVKKEITWSLPGSMPDNMALGVRRSWPCLC